MQVHGKDTRGTHLKKNAIRNAKKAGKKVVKNTILK